MKRRRAAMITGVTLVAVAGAGGWVVATNRPSNGGATPVAEVTTGTAAIVRTSVSERQQVTGTLGYSGTFDVMAPGPGTLTRVPSVGSVVTRGKAAYELNGVPVILFYGARPPWREFGSGMTDGSDVRQLEVNLRVLGYGSGVTVDNHFSSATYWAVRHWQKAVGLPVTGTVPLGQIVFLSGAVRVSTHDLTVGSQVQPGGSVVHGTSPTRAVVVQLSPVQLPSVHVGDPVIVTLPDGSTKNGAIASVGAVVVSGSGTSGSSSSGSSGQSTVTVNITVKGTIVGFLDQAQVQVAVTSEIHKNVLAVPITALRALPGGLYEVIVRDGTTERHVTVDTGLFDEIGGLAEVSGSGLQQGQQVEVPSDGS